MRPPAPPSLNETSDHQTDLKKPRISLDGPPRSSISNLPTDGMPISNDLNESHQSVQLIEYDSDDEPSGVPTTIGASEIDDSLMRRLCLMLEKRALANQEARTKYPDQPKRFMQSEVQLQETLEEMQILAANPSLYPSLATQTQPISLLLGLLAHENTDIALAVIDLLHELLEVNGLRDAGPARVNSFLDLLFKGQLIQFLMQNVNRMDETQKDESEGVHKTLAIVEGLLDVRPELNVTMSNQGLFSWLLRRVQRRPVLSSSSSSSSFDKNKLYVSELLSILLQLDEANRAHLGEVDGIDILLQQLALYKRHDPVNREEIELMHNLFDCLCSALMLPANKDRFLKGEGIQLMNLMLREKHMSRDSALRVLDYALCIVQPSSTSTTALPSATDDVSKASGNADAELAVVSANCAKFIEVLGLRTIFPLFMHSPKERVAKASKSLGNQSDKQKSLGGPTAAEMEEHIINIIGALVRHCPAPSKTRLLAKFVENDHEKVDRLIELHLHYFDRVKATDNRIRIMKENTARWEGYTEDEIEEELTLERLGGGLLALQMLDMIALDVCCNGAPTIMDRLLQLLKMRSTSPRVLLRIVQDHWDSLGDVDSSAEKERLSGLIQKFSAMLP